MRNKVALLYSVTYVRVVVRGLWVQDDRRHGRADGVREFRDKRESVGTGRETEHHKLVRLYSILLHFESCHEGAVPPLAISKVPGLEFTVAFSTCQCVRESVLSIDRTK